MNINSDIQIDDTNEGEVYEEPDKRIAGQKNKREPSGIDLSGLKLSNKPKLSTEAKKINPITDDSKKKPTETKLEKEPSFFLKTYEEPDQQVEVKSQKTRQDIKKDLLNNVFESKIKTGQIKSSYAKQSTARNDSEEFSTTPIDYDMASVSKFNFVFNFYCLLIGSKKL